MKQVIPETLPEPFPMDTLKAGLLYANMGWRVIPVVGKKPAIKAWPQKATVSESQIKSWFAKPKNIGIVTGEESGFVVLDIDPRNGGELSLKRLQERLGKLPRTVTANTGGGGNHYLFQWFEGGKNCSPDNGIDFQYSTGKMIVACPSVHPDTGVFYEWQLSPLERPLAKLPEKWIAHLAGSTNKGGDTTQLGIEERQALFTGEIPKGQRNETLFKLGSILRGKGYSRNSIAVEMSEANLLRCKPKLKDEEVLQIIDRIVKYDAGGKSMKTQWQESVLSDKALDAKAKCVAMGLSLFADAQGRNCYPNQNHIAERTAFNRKTIAKHLDTLYQQGWIHRYTRGRDGMGFSYGYLLKLKDE